MQELILAIAGLILELLVFFCAGSLLTRILKMKTEVTMELVLGYLLYFAVFEILAVPMTLKWVKLSTFSYLWMVIMACLLYTSYRDQSERRMVDQLPGVSGTPEGCSSSDRRTEQRIRTDR